MNRAFRFGKTPPPVKRPSFGETTERLDQPRAVRPTEPIAPGWSPVSPCYPGQQQNRPAVAQGAPALPPPPGPPSPPPPLSLLAWAVIAFAILAACIVGAWLLHTSDALDRHVEPATSTETTAEPAAPPSAAPTPSVSASAPAPRAVPRPPSSSAPRRTPQPARPPLPFNDIRNPWGYD